MFAVGWFVVVGSSTSAWIRLQVKCVLKNQNYLLFLRFACIFGWREFAVVEKFLDEMMTMISELRSINMEHFLSRRLSDFSEQKEVSTLLSLALIFSVTINAAIDLISSCWQDRTRDARTNVEGALWSIDEKGIVKEEGDLFKNCTWPKTPADLNAPWRMLHSTNSPILSNQQFFPAHSPIKSTSWKPFKMARSMSISLSTGRPDNDQTVSHEKLEEKMRPKWFFVKKQNLTNLPAA